MLFCEYHNYFETFKESEIHISNNHEIKPQYQSIQIIENQPEELSYEQEIHQNTFLPQIQRMPLPSQQQPNFIHNYPQQPIFIPYNYSQQQLIPPYYYPNNIQQQSQPPQPPQQ